MPIAEKKTTLLSEFYLSSNLKADKKILIYLRFCFNTLSLKLLEAMNLVFMFYILHQLSICSDDLKVHYLVAVSLQMPIRVACCISKRSPY